MKVKNNKYNVFFVHDIATITICIFASNQEEAQSEAEITLAQIARFPKDWRYDSLEEL